MDTVIFDLYETVVTELRFAYRCPRPMLDSETTVDHGG